MFQSQQDWIGQQNPPWLWHMMVLHCPPHQRQKGSSRSSDGRTRCHSDQHRHSISVGIGWQAPHLHHQFMPTLCLSSAPGCSADLASLLALSTSKTCNYSSVCSAQINTVVDRCWFKKEIALIVIHKVCHDRTSASPQVLFTDIPALNMRFWNHSTPSNV